MHVRNKQLHLPVGIEASLFKRVAIQIGHVAIPLSVLLFSQQDVVGVRVLEIRGSGAQVGDKVHSVLQL